MKLHKDMGVPFTAMLAPWNQWQWDLRLYPGDVGALSLVGREGQLEWTRDADALRVSLPADAPAGRHAYIFPVEKK